MILMPSSCAAFHPSRDSNQWFSRRCKAFFSCISYPDRSREILSFALEYPALPRTGSKTGCQGLPEASYAGHLHFPPSIDKGNGDMATEPITLIDRLWCLRAGDGFVILI